MVSEANTMETTLGEFGKLLDTAFIVVAMDEHGNMLGDMSAEEVRRIISSIMRQDAWEAWQWPIGFRVTKIKGSSWTGEVAGYYFTKLTAEGYVVESENEPGSVQNYPLAALKPADGDMK